MAIKTQKWVDPNGNTYDLPMLFETALKNMMGFTIIPQVTPQYRMKHQGTAQFRINVLTKSTSYYDDKLNYGAKDFVELDLEDPEKIGEAIPYWDLLSDYRDLNYQTNKFKEWGKTMAILREQFWIKKVVETAGLIVSDKTVDLNAGGQIIEDIYSDVLKMTKTVDKFNNHVPRDEIKVIVTSEVGNAIRAFLYVEPRNPELVKTGVLPIGERNGVKFYESEWLDGTTQANYIVLATTATGAAFEVGDKQINTPVSTTNDIYVGFTWRQGAKVFQPNLVIINKPAAPAPSATKTNTQTK